MACNSQPHEIVDYNAGIVFGDNDSLPRDGYFHSDFSDQTNKVLDIDSTSMDCNGVRNRTGSFEFKHLNDYVTEQRRRTSVASHNSARFLSSSVGGNGNSKHTGSVADSTASKSNNGNSFSAATNQAVSKNLAITKHLQQDSSSSSPIVRSSQVVSSNANVPADSVGLSDNGASSSHSVANETSSSYTATNLSPIGYSCDTQSFSERSTDRSSTERNVKSESADSNNATSGDQNGEKSNNHESKGKPGGSSTEKKKRGTMWYNMLNPTYKSRSEDFKKNFKDIPHDERLIVDYACALQKDILHQGRLYVTQNWICFYANIFKWETQVMLRCKDITLITKEKTARVIPNAIQIQTNNDKCFFTSFGARDKSFLMLFRVWQNALLDQPMGNQELWAWVHLSYGQELGLTSSDDDYVAPFNEDEHNPEIASPDDMQEITEADKSLLESYQSSSEAPHHNGILDIDLMSGEKSNLVEEVIPKSKDAKIGGNYSGEAVTDEGHTSDDEVSEGLNSECHDHDHQGLSLIDDVYDLNINTLFNCIFTDCDLYREFVKARKTTDVVQSDWPKEPDSDGKKVRMITYTLSLNYAVGPKSSPTSEKQTMFCNLCRPGRSYVVDAEVVNCGVPYGESFYVVTRYCLSAESSQKTRLRISSKVHYRKSVWGVVKNFIEKSADAGLRDNFSVLNAFLKQEAEKVSLLFGSDNVHHKRKKLLRRKRISSNPSDNMKKIIDSGFSTPNGTPVRSMNSSGRRKINSEVILKWIILLLVILVLFNSILFYKLRSLEEIAETMYLPRKFYEGIHLDSKTTEEWSTLLQSQTKLQEAEIVKWRAVLSSSIQMIEQVKNMLSLLEEKLPTNDPPAQGPIIHQET